MGYTPMMLWVDTDDTDGTNTMRWSPGGELTGQEETWSPQEISWGSQRHTTAAPALARHVDGVYAAWVEPDHYIYTSRLGDSPTSDQNTTVWSVPTSTGFQTAQRPAIASYAGRLYLAWKDRTEGTIHWAPGSAAGWEIAVATPWRTTYGPALGSSLFAGLFMAWRGDTPDSQLHWTQFNYHDLWFDGPDNRFGGWTAASPTLVGTFGHIYMGWRGDQTADFNDTRLWWSRYDGGWAEQRPLDGWSTTGPGLATSDGQTVYMAYTEQFPQEGHGQIWWTHSTPSLDWTGQQPLGSRKTYFSPAIV